MKKYIANWIFYILSLLLLGIGIQLMSAVLIVIGLGCVIAVIIYVATS